MIEEVSLLPKIESDDISLIPMSILVMGNRGDGKTVMINTLNRSSTPYAFIEKNNFNTCGCCVNVAIFRENIPATYPGIIEPDIIIFNTEDCRELSTASSMIDHLNLDFPNNNIAYMYCDVSLDSFANIFEFAVKN